MKRSVAAIAAVLALALVIGTQAKAQYKTTGGTEEKLRQLERDWTNASLKNDTAALDRLLADDWVEQGPEGTLTKAQLLADIKSGNVKMESQTLGDMKVRVFGNTAVVAGSDDEKSSYKGKDTSGHYTWTDVWISRNGKWQAVATQVTSMPAK